MMARVKRELDPAEVDAMMNGTWEQPTLTAILPERSTPWLPRYDRCSNCSGMMPALLSFSGDSEWSPEIALDDPLRLEVSYLRMSTGKRTVLLCPPCIDDLRSTGAARVAEQITPTLFGE